MYCRWWTKWREATSWCFGRPCYFCHSETFHLIFKNANSSTYLCISKPLERQRNVGSGIFQYSAVLNNNNCKTFRIQTEHYKLCIIVDLTFRITNCRFPTRDCIPYVRSGLSQLVIRVKGFRVCALHCGRANDLDFAFCIGSFRRGHHAFRESSFVSPAHGPRWRFLLSRHRKTISAAVNQKPFVNKDLCTRNSVKRIIKRWEPNALLRLGNLKCQAVLVGS